jgi:uncharacterized RDD family membrane protein YckC
MPAPIAQSSPSPLVRQPPVSGSGNCRTCGFQNLELDLRCHKCGRRLPAADAAAHGSQAAGSASERAVQHEAPKAVAEVRAAVAPSRPALPDHVKSEIHSKVERFRARRRSQTLQLPFAEPVLLDEESVVPFPTLENDSQVKITHHKTASRESAVMQIAAESASSPAAPASEEQTLEHPITTSPDPVWQVAQPSEVAFGHSASQPPRIDVPTQAPLFIPLLEPVQPDWQTFQIATLGKRLQGITHDFGCMVMGIALFAAPFYWIAGAPQVTVRLIGAFAGASLLMALFYGFLFLGMFGETPGMAATGLRIVSFSGQPATLQQRLLRVAGSIVSSGSFLCGYLWAFVDEETLCWHDHISKTILTDSAE